MHRRRKLFWITLALLPILSVMWFGWAMDATAAPLLQEATPTPQPAGTGGEKLPEQLSISDEVCLGCHGQPGQTLALQDGSTLELYVPGEAHAVSVHGKSGMACVQCHRTVGEYPHPSFSAKDARDVSLQLYDTCRPCHSYQYDNVADSVHNQAIKAGNREAAICVDCHTAHDVHRLKDPATKEFLPDARVWIPTTCARCHSKIYEQYQNSVHGSALIGAGNQDVPTCIDCHGVHSIVDPTTARFRLKSPEMCAKCHTDPKIMNQYGISTQVLNTYVADFHGTTVELFAKESPDAEVNKPVCYDCHGVHDIKRPDDPEKGLQTRSNLLARCQTCHPDADTNFPDAWMSHYIPSPDKFPIVYYVNLFYKFFIPGVLIPMAILAAMDFARAQYNRYRRRQNAAVIPHVAGPLPAAATHDPELSAPDADVSKTE